MATLASRVVRLEASQPRQVEAQRVYSVVGGRSDEEVENFIKAEGYPVTDADLILRFVSVAPSPNGPEDVSGPPRWFGLPPSPEWRIAK